jgi:hypothetical protein
VTKLELKLMVTIMMKQSISHGPLSIPIRYWATLPRNSEQSRAHGNGSQGTWHCKCAVAVLDCSRMPDLTDRPTLTMSSCSSQFNKVSKTGTTTPKPETSILSRKLNLKSLYYLKPWLLISRSSCQLHFDPMSVPWLLATWGSHTTHQDHLVSQWQ